MSINKNLIYSKYLTQVIPKYIFNIHLLNYNIIISLNYKNIKKLLKFLKLNNNSQFNLLLDIFAIDKLGLTTISLFQKRYQLCYNVLSLYNNLRIILKINVVNFDFIESLTILFNSSNWLEREIWDMFGIFFYNHPDLRRILTDYGFEGFPLLKDFPLSGYLEVRYDFEQKKIVLEPIELTQEFRYFDFKNPWE